MSQMEKKAFLVVTSQRCWFFLYYNSPGESIHTYIGIYKKELLLIYKFCVADFVPSCNLLIAWYADSRYKRGESNYYRYWQSRSEVHSHVCISKD